jgi:hypothetical protein
MKSRYARPRKLFRWSRRATVTPWQADETILGATATSTPRTEGNAYHALPIALPKQKIRQGRIPSNSIDPRWPESVSLSGFTRYRGRRNRSQTHCVDRDQTPTYEWHSGGRRFDPDRFHQASFSAIGRERNLPRRSQRRSRAVPVSITRPRTPPGQASHLSRPSDENETCHGVARGEAGPSR